MGRGERDGTKVHLQVRSGRTVDRRSQRTAFFAYANNYLIDLKAAIILDVEATRAIRQAEVGAARTMIERTEDRLGLCPERVAADSAYGSAEMLGWLVNERAIEPHIPVFDKSARVDGTFSREAFAYNQQSDVYICPADKVLASTGTQRARGCRAGSCAMVPLDSTGV